MKIGLIADTHSNLPALKAVLDVIDVDQILCAGDIVGYYPYPKEVIETVKRHKIISIRGNHDVAVLTGDTSWFNPIAASAIEWTRDNISQSGMKFLEKLPAQLMFEDVTIVHGSPHDPNEYVYPTTSPAKLEKFLDQVSKKVLVLGHTHVQWSFELGGRKIINPGAVGQPRDGNPKAAYAIFDTKSEEFTMHRIEYDVEETASKTLEVGLPQHMARRLFFGL
ncbi:MAG: YfcE family phosphodiesterase [Methanosarcinales archaeon Met12]|nr:MAG: YfcE family phosphodiesterase [Methanosarcinales archaeon Met12]